MGVAAPQAHAHDLFGAGNRRQEWVIATPTGVTEAGTLLFKPVGLTDRRVHVQGDRPLTGPGTGRP